MSAGYREDRSSGLEDVAAQLPGPIKPRVQRGRLVWGLMFFAFPSLVVGIALLVIARDRALSVCWSGVGCRVATRHGESRLFCQAALLGFVALILAFG